MIPTVERILQLHSSAIDEFGGKMSLPKPGCVEGSIDGTLTAAQYHDDPDNPLLLAATLLFKLVKVKHCFVDGNKRIGWMAAIDMFASQGLKVEAEQVEATAMVLQVAEGSLNVDEISMWFADRLCALE